MNVQTSQPRMFNAFVATYFEMYQISHFKFSFPGSAHLFKWPTKLEGEQEDVTFCLQYCIIQISSTEETKHYNEVVAVALLHHFSPRLLNA